MCPAGLFTSVLSDLTGDHPLAALRAFPLLLAYGAAAGDRGLS